MKVEKLIEYLQLLPPGSDVGLLTANGTGVATKLQAGFVRATKKVNKRGIRWTTANAKTGLFVIGPATEIPLHATRVWNFEESK